MKLLELKDEREFKLYELTPQESLFDILKRINQNPNITIKYGERNTEHDVGLGCDLDYERFDSLEDFLGKNDDYTRAFCQEIQGFDSHYYFVGTYKGKEISLGFFCEGERIGFGCKDENVDLNLIIEEALN